MSGISRKRVFLSFLPLIVGLAVPIPFMGFVVNNRVGPVWFWSTDACPDPAVSCGIIPMVALAAGILGFVSMAATGLLLNWMGFDLSLKTNKEEA